MKKFALLLSIVFYSSALPVEATEPSHWTLSTQEEFLQGELTGVSVTSDGRLVLAPDLEMLLETEEAFIFDALTDRGGNVFLATGSNGKIFRQPAGGNGSEWAKLNEPSVYALAVDSSNRIYAGTSPDGKVYRLNSQGQPEIFFDPGEKYIWALAVDAQNNVFVATGPKGIIYKVAPDGQGTPFYDSKETHIVSLTVDAEGNLLAGGAPEALLYRISPAGSAFVLYDSPLQELKAIAYDRYGNVYAAALGGPEGSEPPTVSAATKSSSEPSEDENGSPDRESTVSVAGTEKGKKLEVYKIDRQNLVETLYTSNDQLAFDLLVRSDGNVLVGTGNQGRIVSISPDKLVTFLAQSPEEQITHLLEHDRSLYVVTSNLGKLFRLLTTPSKAGVYESKPLDAGVASSWGTIRWFVKNQTTGVKVYTRSGNTEDPDGTWSNWSEPYQNSGGSAVLSPAARYLQWKIEFPEAGRSAAVVSDSNAVELVTVSYLQRNLAPQVESVTVHPPGVALVQFPNSNPSGGVSPGGPAGAHLRSLPRSIRNIDRGSTPPARRVYIPGARSFSWQASDRNQDDLAFSIYYRTQEVDSWKLLKDGLTESHFTMDGVSFPRGTYFVKVVASDLPSNPQAQALSSELVSKAFVISNSSPSVEVAAPQLERRQASVQFTADTGGFSTVHQAEYSVDSETWHIIFPQDGIADTPSEQFSFTTEALESGAHVISIRVVDSVGNIGTGKVAVTIP
ncbi:MAG: hypothetical protein ACRD1R_12000 [Acidobacteriota bacterium]